MLKPCPSCGKDQMTDDERGDVVPYSGKPRRCDWCNCTTILDWNTRPIEDELQNIIAKKDANIAVLIATIEELKGAVAHDLRNNSDESIANLASAINKTYRIVRDIKEKQV